MGVVQELRYYDPVNAGGYELLDGNGNLVRDTDFLGQYTLVTFGYTNCADSCPLTLSTLSAALDELGDLADQVQPILISVEPERDTPERMGTYVAAFDERILGLTGSMEQVEQAAEMFKTSFEKVPANEGANYTVDHPTVMYLMGPDGRYVTHFDHHISAGQLALSIERSIEDAVAEVKVAQAE